MNKQMLPYYFYMLGTVAFTIYGQLILKWRISMYGHLPDAVSDKIWFLLKALLDPFIFSGLFAAFIASLFWMAAMTRLDVSFAYPLMTAGMVLITSIMAIVILSEPVTMNKVIGIMMIVGGVLVMMRNG